MSAPALIAVYPPAALGPASRRAAPAFPFDEPALTFTHLGRGAVWLALKALGLGPGSRIAMPAYHCGSEVDAAHVAGCEIDFYRVDAGLHVDADDLARAAARCDAVYLVSHFGFPMAEPPPGAAILIEDAAHALFSLDAAGRPIGSRGAATIFCPRKSLGVPDGGALRLADRAPAANPEGRMSARAAARSYASLAVNRAAMARLGLLRGGAARLLGRASKGDAAARAGTLTETVIGEWGLEPADLDAAAARPAPLTPWLARRADAGEVRARRREHYAALLDAFGELVPESCRVLPEGCAPLYLPVRVSDREAAMVRLLDGGVRALEVWPVPHPRLDRDRFSELEPLRAGLLALPVHQTMRPWHVERVIAAGRRALR